MDWNDYAATWDEEPGVRAYASSVLSCVEAAFADAGGLSALRVLDFGCGTGVLTQALAERCQEVVALEPASKMLAVLEAKVRDRGWSRVHPVLGTLESAAGDAHLRAPFDLVVASSVCAFVPDYPATLAGLVGRLRSGGLLMQFDWERGDAVASEEGGDEIGFTAAEIRTGLTAAGLEAVNVSTGFSTPTEDMVMAPLLGTGRRPARRS